MKIHSVLRIFTNKVDSGEWKQEVEERLHHPHQEVPKIKEKHLREVLKEESH